MEKEPSVKENLEQDGFQQFDERFQALSTTPDDCSAEQLNALRNRKYNELDDFSSYGMSTVSSNLPPYQHGEIERIRNSYSTGTFRTIKKLPNCMETNAVQCISKKYTLENRILTCEKNFKPASRLKAHDFHPQRHITMNYEKGSYINQYVVEEEKIRTDSYSRKPFVVSERIRGKFEDIFGNPNYAYPKMGPGGIKIDLEDVVRFDPSRSNRVQLGSLYAGRFHIAAQRLSHECQMQVQDWAQKIHAQLVEDWGQLAFRIRFTKTQELLVQFKQPEPSRDATAAPFPPPNNALLKYMQHLAVHGLGSDFLLQKRGDRWHVLELDPMHTHSDWGDTWASASQERTTSLAMASQRLGRGRSQQSCSQDQEGEREEYNWFALADQQDAHAASTRTSHSHGSKNHARSPAVLLPLVVSASSSSSRKQSATQRTASATMLDTLEELSQHASDAGEEGDQAKHLQQQHVFLTFAFYAPWVIVRQQDISKKLAVKHRQKAREYAEKRRRIYSPKMAQLQPPDYPAATQDQEVPTTRGAQIF
jgi:hypothetical protein